MDSKTFQGRSVIRRFALLVALLFQVSLLQAQAVGSQRGNGADAPRARPGDRVVLKLMEIDVENAGVQMDTFLVAQNGNVVLPRPLGPTRADGVIISELEDSIRTAYTTYLRNPYVEVFVLRRISVLGEVQEPGIYLADLTMGIPELVARAGGPTENGNARHVTIIRGAERFVFKGNQEQEMFLAELHSGDQVIIGRKNFLVRNPWASISTVFTLITLARQLGIW